MSFKLLNLLRRVKHGIDHPILAIRRLQRRLELKRQFHMYIGSGNKGVPIATVVKRKSMVFPTSAEEIITAPFFRNQHWYYDVELLPNVIAKGIYPADIPFLPRILLRNCALEHTTCLDLGSMEGIIPVLMKRQGAKAVVATDAYDESGDRMEALKHYYQTEFDFYTVGLMYDLYRKFPGKAFDLINCSDFCIMCTPNCTFFWVFDRF